MKAHILTLLVVFVALGQAPQGGRRGGFPPSGDEGLRLPNGKSQKEEMLKEDYRKNVEDSQELAKLAEELRSDIEKDDRYIVSVKTLKKTDDIEKLAKRIRGRLKRF